LAVSFLEAGKHVWCEKPMALTLDEAEAMAAAAARAKGRTLLGYNYIKNPAVLHARNLVENGAIGEVVHFRGQVDEDYLASPDVPWSKRARIDLWGLGTLGDITCHLVSFAHLLIGDIVSVAADMDTVVRERPVPGTGEMREVENEDIAHAIVRFENGISGTLVSSRAAWGRKNLIRFEIHGRKGMLTFDQERLNELQLYVADGPEATRGFRTILTGPAHPPYAQFTPVAGHQLGFNELKVIEAKHLLDCIADGSECFVNFAEGLKIERVIHGMARSARERKWVEVS
jgi:predicted dehydrogenase